MDNLSYPITDHSACTKC